MLSLIYNSVFYLVEPQPIAGDIELATVFCDRQGLCVTCYTLNRLPDVECIVKRSHEKQYGGTGKKEQKGWKEVKVNFTKSCQD